MQMTPEEVALFPLHTVLFPGGVLPLRIFEPRYLDMVRRCTRDASEFGVALISEGVEAGGSATTHQVGTLGRIVDFDQTGDGLLAITVLGTSRFRVASVRQQTDGLNLAHIERLAADPAVPLPAEFANYAALLRRVLPQTGKHLEFMTQSFDDAAWVAARMTDVLPLPPAVKQHMLELDDPVARLHVLRPLLE